MAILSTMPVNELKKICSVGENKKSKYGRKSLHIMYAIGKVVCEIKKRWKADTNSIKSSFCIKTRDVNKKPFDSYAQQQLRLSARTIRRYEEAADFFDRFPSFLSTLADQGCFYDCAGKRLAKYLKDNPDMYAALERRIEEDRNIKYRIINMLLTYVDCSSKV
jgi:hypothetical protein